MIFLVLMHTLATCGDHDKLKCLSICIPAQTPNLLLPVVLDIHCNGKSGLRFLEIFITLHFVVLKVMLFKSAHVWIRFMSVWSALKSS